MKVTQFWQRMHDQFGVAYSDVLARDQVISKLGSRTAVEALEDGQEPREIWLALCEQLEVPAADRH